MDWFIPAFLAQLLWVSGNLFDKYLISDYRSDNDSSTAEMTPMVLLMFSGIFSLVVLIALVVFAFSTKQEFETSFGSVSVGILCGILNFMWLSLYLHAIAKSELSKVIPLFQTIPIFAAVTGYLFLGEVLTHLDIFFGCIILFGALILMFKTQTKVGGRVHRFDKSVFVMMLCASFLIAVSEALFKHVALDSTFLESSIWTTLGMVVACATWMCVSTETRRSFTSTMKKGGRRIIALNAVNEIIDNMAFLMFSYATTVGTLAIVQTSMAYQPALVFGSTLILTLLGSRSYREDMDPYTILQKVTGIALITIGSYFILAHG
jgi:drug/metabolite transporter (DMT)-like permease